MKGIQKIKWSGKGKIEASKSKPNVSLCIVGKSDAGFVVDKWFSGTTEEDKKKNVTWILQDNKRKEIRRIQKSAKEEFTLNIPNALCGPYNYYLEASFSGKIDTKNNVGLHVNGYCTPKILSSKWSTSNDGADVRKQQFKYGHLVYLGLVTEGLNGEKSLVVEIYKTIQGGNGTKDDKLVATITSVDVIDGEINLKIGNTANWFVHAKKDVEEFYIKIKNTRGNYISDGKSDIHARFLRMKKDQVTKAVEPSTNNTPLKVGETTMNFSTPISCKYNKIVINDKDSNNGKITAVLYDELNSDLTKEYQTLASSEEGKTFIDINFEKLKNDKCYTKPEHKKEVDLYINDVKQKTEIINDGRFNLPIKAYANKTLLRTNPGLFFVTPDPINKYILIAKTCGQPNNPIQISVYPKVEREVAFVLSLFKTFNAEINQKYSNREKLTDYNQKQSMQLIRNEVEILYQTKGGLGYGLSAKVKVDNVESSIELGVTKNQIKKLIGFYHTVQEVLSVFDGKGREEQSIAYSAKKLPKVTFDIEPPNIALAVRITNKKIAKSNELVRQFTGGLALKPITKIKIGVDLLSLLQYMGIGGKIANWIKKELEEHYNFTIYIIFEVSLEAKSELSLTYNKIEGFAPGTRKLQIEAAIGIKGGVKSTEFVTVLVPEADGKLQEAKVEKFKGEASGVSSILYSYEVKSDNKGQYSQHKMEFTGVKATIVVYAIRKGMKYNETIRKDFTVIKKPDKPWYESDKEYVV
ncbi:hypothetical protein SY27_08105 [Flavobacterium sp. 316]|uniref:hypothetical protein n=1 Tax=Flavobacterium sp. 316 TaxID=1603293 RepID=UPI0005DE7F53|nr:hypothetical protein [Flavobacterium sp. 316]KIX21649.1 hypothetical protein SY27_08105 [Flavobacterium sp. 316]